MMSDSGHGTEGGSRERRKRKQRSQQVVVAEQAEAYGVSIPLEANGNERFLSPNDIGKILNVTGEAVKQWIYRRKLPAVKLANGYWKVKVTDFETFLRARHEIGKRHVLVADAKGTDNADVAKAIDALGAQPVLARNYADAMLKAMDHYPALFVITLAEGDSEPWKLAEKIRSTKQLRSLPILFLSNKPLSDVDTDRAMNLGAQGMLSRPFDFTLLKDEINRILIRSM